jgi:acetyltransferase-like isoleucine patch superfamily enzyme
VNQIAATAQISRFADLEESVRGSRLVVGDNVMIDSFVKIKFAGGLGDVLIGAESYVNSGTVIYSGHGVRIGEGVLIAANCTLAPVSHQYARREIPIREQGFRDSRGGIVIEDDVWIGAGCIILDGSILRRGCVVAAGSVVREEVPEFTIMAGNPLRRIGVRK